MSLFFSGRRVDGRRGGSWAGLELRPVVESAALFLLLIAVVVCALAGAGTALLWVLATAWLVLIPVVGIRRVLDAGCVFMLVAVGIVMVVDLARNGPGSLLP